MIDKLAPHDLRRTCACLCHLAGGELDQIQFLLGHATATSTNEAAPSASWPCPRCGAAMIVGPILSALHLATLTIGFDTS